MEPWIALTLAAATAQTLRFLLQRHLKLTTLTSGGATLARFLYSAPLAALGLAIYLAATGLAIPPMTPSFWAYALPGGLAQIAATICVMSLFALRNFAVGMTFAKTEVMQTALLGAVLLGDVVTFGGAVAIGIGFLGVLALSRGGAVAPPGPQAVLLGVGAGALFAVSATCYRGATLSLGDGDVALRAGLTLAIVTAFQAVALSLWLRVNEPRQVRAVIAAWRVALPTGVASIVGSFCWFAAFALQNAAYVKALGQIELVLAVAASTLLLGERIARREACGIALLLLSVLGLVLVA